MKDNLTHYRTSVCNINYYIVWSVKYRKKVDADKNASVNIRDRTDDKDIMDVCVSYANRRKMMQSKMKDVYKERNNEYIKLHNMIS